MKMDNTKNSPSGTDVLSNSTEKNINLVTLNVDKGISEVVDKMEKTLKKLSSVAEEEEDDVTGVGNVILDESNSLKDSRNLDDNSMSPNIFDVTRMICPAIGVISSNQLYTIVNGVKVRKTIFEMHKNVVNKEMESIKEGLKKVDGDHRVSLRSLTKTILKDNERTSFLQSMLDAQDKSIIEEFKKYFERNFNLAVRVPGNDIFISLVPEGGRKCNCNNCLEGCMTKNCLMDEKRNIHSTNLIKKSSEPENVPFPFEEKIQAELEYFINEIEQRGDSNVAFIDVCNQYLIDKRVTSSLYMLFYNGTQKEYSYCVEVLSKHFSLSWKGCDGLTLSMKDLDFGEEKSIEKPCSLAHEKEIEDGLEAVIAGGDILCEDEADYYSCKDVFLNNSSSSNTNTTAEEENSMTITEMLINKAGFENGDALEQFICSRIEYYIADTGYDRILISELDTVINSFFEMHVDPMREFGKGWPEMCQKWVDKKYLYFSKDKTAIMVTDPETPELYLEDHDKIFADNQQDNERIIDELAIYGINLKPYVLFRNGQPHIIIEDASLENNSK